MKKANYISLIILALLFQLAAGGQNLNGTYKCGNEFLSFHNDTVTFSLKEGVCLVSTYEASGLFFVNSNHLIIRPFLDTFKTNIAKTKRQYKDSILFQFFANNNDSIYPSIKYYTNRKEIIGGESIGQTQKSYLKGKFLELTDSILVQYVGYIPVAFKLDKDYDYKILLQKGKNKSDYEQFLNSNRNGFEIKIKHDRILLKRQNYLCEDANFYWQTFILE